LASSLFEASNLPELKGMKNVRSGNINKSCEKTRQTRENFRNKKLENRKKTTTFIPGLHHSFPTGLESVTCENCGRNWLLRYNSIRCPFCGYPSGV